MVFPSFLLLIVMVRFLSVPVSRRGGPARVVGVLEPASGRASVLIRSRTATGVLLRAVRPLSVKTRIFGKCQLNTSVMIRGPRPPVIADCFPSLDCLVAVSACPAIP